MRGVALFAMPVPSDAPHKSDGTDPGFGPQMTVIANQTPPARKPPPRQPWTDWLVISVTLAGAWCGLCWLVQAMTEG